MTFIIQEFHRLYADSDQCLKYLFDLKHSDTECPKCERKNSYHRHHKKQCFTCNCGQSHIYPKVGTIFEASPLPVGNWFYAIFLMNQEEGGVSAMELKRKLFLTYPTVWRMAKRIRSCMPSKEEFLPGTKERFDVLLDKCIYPAK